MIVEMLKFIRKEYKKNKANKAFYSKIAKACFRYYTDTKKSEYISEAAMKKAKELGIDLKTMTWKTQTKYDKKRLIFHYEHCNTIHELTERLLETNEPVENILKYYIVCLILKKENKKLYDNVFKSKRPGGWQKCYKQCGIKYKKNR